VTSASRTEVRVVDDRTFLRGLDQLYRDAMRVHERDELLKCARALCEALGVAPKDVPIEGYYSEEAELTEYFRRVRALQDVSSNEQPRVDAMPAFQRLKAVTSSPIFGLLGDPKLLLPTGRDPLSLALRDLQIGDWGVAALTAKAREIAHAGDDYSLVGLAAFVGDAVVLAALRETAVLYAEVVAGSAWRPVEITYDWRVHPKLAARAQRFVSAFNDLFGEDLPAPIAANVEQYWLAACASHVLHRCVRIGLDDRVIPNRNYHWAICTDATHALAVHEFWHQDLWTTERFRNSARAQEPLP